MTQLELPMGLVPQRAAEKLTERQREVFDLICEGKSMDEMCVALGIGEKGVKWHIRLILQKTQCRNRKELRAKLGLLINE